MRTRELEERARLSGVAGDGEIQGWIDEHRASRGAAVKRVEHSFAARLEALVAQRKRSGERALGDVAIPAVEELPQVAADELPPAVELVEEIPPAAPMLTDVDGVYEARGLAVRPAPLPAEPSPRLTVVPPPKWHSPFNFAWHEDD